MIEMRESVFWILVIAGFVVAAVAVIWGFVLAFNYTYVGQRYEVTITVQAVEYSTRFGKHTNLWAQVYGEQDITYKLCGYVDVEVGKTYKIVFVNTYAVLGWEVWGRVESIKEVGD